jgi:hypothetical protein
MRDGVYSGDEGINTLNDDEFIAEIRRHLIAIIKAIFKRFGVDLLKIK